MATVKTTVSTLKLDDKQDDVCIVLPRKKNRQISVIISGDGKAWIEGQDTNGDWHVVEIDLVKAFKDGLKEKEKTLTRSVFSEKLGKDIFVNHDTGEVYL